MKHLNAANAASIIDLIHVSAPSVRTCAPAAPCLGPLTKNNIPGVVKGMVKAKKITLTIRPLVSLAWSGWSRWSRHFQLIAHARVCLCRPSFLTFIFKLIKIALTTLTTLIKSTVYALTIPLTNIDHPDHKGF